MNNIVEMFSYNFIVNAFIVGILISICSSLIGITIVLKRNSMIGDGLSHVGFGAFAIATVLHFAPLEFALPIVMLASFLILKLNENSKLHGDSAIALISSSSLAIGTFIISITKGVNTDINNYLFGSILSIDNSDLLISVILFIIVIIVYIISYHKIFAITFVIGMRIMGSLLISSLIIFPKLTSMKIFKKFKTVVISSIIVSVIAFTSGLILSYILEAPTGATIVIVNLIILIIFKLFSFIKNIK